MQLEFWEQQLPFEYPFTISNGRTKTHQHSLMVKLSLGNWVGYGEAPAIVYYNVTVQGMMEQLEKQRKLIEKFALIDPERFWHFLHHLFPQDPFLVCALDMAGWDFASRPTINDRVSTRNGRIVFKITVDDSGRVVQAVPLEYNVSNDVLAYYRQVVNQINFKKSGSAAPDFSTGRITFVIKVD